MFEGARGSLEWLLPILEPSQVADRIITAICRNHEVVVIPPLLYAAYLQVRSPVFVCCTLYAVCSPLRCVLYATCSMLQVECSMRSVGCYSLCAACMLYVVCKLARLWQSVSVAHQSRSLISACWPVCLCLQRALFTPWWCDIVYNILGTQSFMNSFTGRQAQQASKAKQ